MKAPLILGNDIPNESSETLSVLANAEAAAVSQDALGVQAQRVNTAALPAALAPRSLEYGRGNHAVLARCDASRATQHWALRADGVLATADAAGKAFCLGSVDGAAAEGSWAGVDCASPAAARFAASARNANTGAVALVSSRGEALSWNNAQATGPAPHTRHVLAVSAGGPAAPSAELTREEAAGRARWLLLGGAEGGSGGAIMAADRAGIVDDDGAGGRGVAGGDYCLDVQAGQLETWCGPLAGGKTAVALFNRSPAAAPITVSFAQCNASNTNAVRDIWAAADRGSATGSYTATVASQATAFLVLTPA